MCTTWSTRNRAVIINNYATTTLLTSKDAYCPCGPNYQDYSYRSRLYNPDPKYACHTDLTCHQFDSIPQAMSCSGYGMPSQSMYSSTMGSSCSDQQCDTGSSNRPPRCKRRVIRPRGCCLPSPTLRDFICTMKCCEPPCPCPCPSPCPYPCPPQNCCDNAGEDDDEDDDCNRGPDGGYSVELPQSGDCCEAKVTYNCGPCGDICRTVQMPGGNQVQTNCGGDSVILETVPGCPTPRIRGCCPPIECLPNCCPPPCCPPPCGPPPVCPFPCCPCSTPMYCPGSPSQCCPIINRCPGPTNLRCYSRNLRYSQIETTVGPMIGCGCKCLECRPRFRNP